MNNAERNQEARDIHNDVMQDNGRGLSGTCPSDCSPSRLDYILRWLARDNGSVLGCRPATMIERVQMVMDRMSLTDQSLLRAWLNVLVGFPRPRRKGQG